MKPLANLLYKISGQSYITKLRKGVEEAKAATAKAYATANHWTQDEIAKRRTKLQAALVKEPTAQAVDALVAFEAQAAVAVKVTTDLHFALQMAEQEKITGLGNSLFEGALKEVYDGFEEQRAAIVAHDLKQSQELGVECVSTAALRQLDRTLENLDQSGILFRGHNMPMAVNAILTAITPPPAPRPEVRDVRSHPDEDVQDRPAYNRTYHTQRA